MYIIYIYIYIYKKVSVTIMAQAARFRHAILLMSLVRLGACTAPGVAPP